MLNKQYGCVPGWLSGVIYRLRWWMWSLMLIAMASGGQVFAHVCDIHFTATAGSVSATGGAVTKSGNEYLYSFSQSDYNSCDPGGNPAGDNSVSAMGIYPDAVANNNLGGVRTPGNGTTSTASAAALAGVNVWVMSNGGGSSGPLTNTDLFYYTPPTGFSGNDTFTYYSAANNATYTVTVTVPSTLPVISGITPSAGGIAGGTSVTLNGSNLSGVTSIKFGTSTALAISANSATSVTATAPSHAAGTVDISVTTAQGSNVNTVADDYTYVTPATAMPVAATVGYGTSSNSITLSISGGAATSVAVATAPTHGTASATGTAISYTPTPSYSGSDSFTYTATNAAGTSSAATVTITVSPPTLAISPVSGSALSAVTTGPYSQTFVAASGTAPYSYALAINTGSLPSGLSFNATTGVLSGTPSTSGVVSFTVTATDSSTGSSTFSVAGSYTLTVSAVPTGTLSFSSPGPASVTLGASLTNAATSTVSGADKGVISYSSSDNTVATVNGSGVVTTLSAGTTVITATQAAVAGKNAQASQSYTLTVTSLPVGTVSFATPGSASLIIGNSLTNAATSTLSGASYGTISYHSSVPGVATVNGSGVITTVSVGTTVITATQAAVAGVNALAAQSYTLTVNPVPTPTLTFATAGSASVALGHTLSNSASSTLSGGSYGAISYSSSDTSVATVNSSGVVTPVSAGTATITATQAASASNLSASQSYTLTVLALPVGTVSFSNPGSASLPVGNSLSNPASSTLSGGSYGAISYSSSNTSVAAVTSSGVVTALSAGTATITATQAATAANAQASQSYSLTVSAVPVGVVSFSTPGSASVTMGSTLTNAASSTLSGGSYGAISYSSSNTAVATVNSSGVVTPQSVGSAVITATQAAVNGVNGLATQSYNLTVGAGSTSVVLTSSLSAPLQGESLTLTATITPGSATGTVHFYDGSNSLGQSAVSSGHASLVLSSLSVGSHALTAAYSGDGSTAAATSAVTTVAVGQRPDPTTNAVVKQSVTTQVATVQRFSQAQLTNIYSHVQLLHGDFTIRNRFGMGLNSPKLSALRSVGNALYDNFAKLAQNQSGTNARVASASDLPDLSAFPLVKHKVASKPQMQELAPREEEDSEDQPVSDTDVLHIGGMPVGIWSAGSVDIGSMDGANGNRTKFNSTGLTVGMDMQWSRNLILGLSLGYAQGSTSMDTMGSDSNSRMWSGSLYATYRPAKKWFIDALVGAGSMGYDNHRWDDQNSLLLSGNRRGTVVYGSFSLTREVEIKQFRVHPFGRFDLSETQLDHYSEHGSAMALTYNDTRYSTSSFTGGLEIFKDFYLASGQLTPSIKLQVTHRTSGDASQTIYYTDMGANSTNYTMIASSGTPEDTQSFGLGVNFKNHYGLQTNLSWLGSIGGNAYRSNSFRLDVRMGF